MSSKSKKCATVKIVFKVHLLYIGMSIYVLFKISFLMSCVRFEEFSQNTLTLNFNPFVFIGQTFSQLPIPEGNLSEYLLNLVFTGLSVNSSYQTQSVLKPDEVLPQQTGNKTECALLGFVNSNGGDYTKIREEHPEDQFVKVYTFNSARKSMSTVIRTGDGWRLFCKGAAEIVLKK